MYSKDKTGKENDMKYLSDEANILTNQTRLNTSLFIEITANEKPVVGETSL